MAQTIGADLAGRVALPADQDASPNRRFQAIPEEEGVRLVDTFTGSATTLPTPGYKPKCASASDDGSRVAFLANRPGSLGMEQVVGVVGQDAPQQIVAQDWTVNDVDLAPDGSVVYSRYMDIHVVDAAGDRVLARMPSPPTRVECLPDGRILAETTTFAWGPPNTPIYSLVERDGQISTIGDPEVADTLGQPVLEILRSQYERVFPSASPSQREALQERFGYDTPTYRMESPGQAWTAFSVTRGLSNPAEEGVYVLPSGTGGPRRIPDLEGLDNASWSADEKRVALQGKDERGRRHLVLAETGSDRSKQLALPWELMGDGAPTCHWSPDGRYTVIQSHDREPLLHAYDWDKDLLFRLPSKGHVVRWEEGQAVLKTGDAEQRITLAPPGVENAEEYLFGEPRQEPAGSIHVGDDYVEIGPVRVPRR